MGLEVTDVRSALLAPTSVTVAAGAVMAVRGASGSGKTLLLRAIADLDPSEGDVRLDGVERHRLTGPAWRQRVRYLAAEPGWWRDEVGAHFLEPDAQGPGLARLGLPPDAMRWPVSRASTGERQRLAFLRAIEDRPRVILLDEPTGGLDTAAARALEAMLVDLLRHGACALLVTHDDAQDARLASGRIVMGERRGEARLP